MRAKNTAETFRHVRYLCEAYTQPEQFPTPEDYLRALTEGLDNLTQAIGEQPPAMHDVWSNA